MAEVEAVRADDLLGQVITRIHYETVFISFLIENAAYLVLITEGA